MVLIGLVLGCGCESSSDPAPVYVTITNATPGVYVSLDNGAGSGAVIVVGDGNQTAGTIAPPAATDPEETP